MKAVCVLLCLGLARYSAGHIFNRQYRPQWERFVEDLNNQYQYRENQLPEQIRYQQEAYYPQQYQKVAEYQRPVEYQQPATYQRPTEYQQHAQYQKLAHPKYTRHVIEADKHNEVEAEVTHSSAERMPVEAMDSSLFAAPVFADPDMPITANLRMASELNEAFGDPIQWRGIQIAVGPHSNLNKKEQIARIFRDAQFATKHVAEKIKKQFHEIYENLPSEETEDATLNTTQLSMKYQYPVDKYTVRTEDGYDLTLFRILKKKSDDMTPRPVVFLMHGLLGSSDDWMLMGEQSLPYLLAEEGFDVWLGNARGNKYSRRHASMHPAQPEFWSYSNDEIALHDLPAMIDFALKTSAQQKLYYIGYSQGTMNYFALVSARPEYNDKVVMMYALSPMAYMSNVRSPLVKMIAPNSPMYDDLYERLGRGEFKPSKELLNTMGGQLCETELGCKKVCSNANFVMSGVNLEHMDIKQIRVVMGHLPAGGSTRQIKQYGQAAASHEFRRYDYGVEINEHLYGDITPPKFELEKITTPVALYYSNEDWLAHPKDVERLKMELPNVTEYYKVPVEHFSHMDYVFSRMAPEAIYKRLIESMKSHN